MKDLIDFYGLLGVSYYATIDEIKEAYRKKVKETHPDKTNGDSEQFKQIIEAYEVLSNDEKRKRYDDILFKATKPKNGTESTKKEVVLPGKKVSKKIRIPKASKIPSFFIICATSILIGIVINLNDQYQIAKRGNSILDSQLTSMSKENQVLSNDISTIDSRLTSMIKENQD